MNCDEFKKVLGDYLDDDVARELYHEVRSHLAACGSCSVEVDTLRKTILIYRGSTSPPVLDEGCRSRLFASLTFEYRNSRRSPAP